MIKTFEEWCGEKGIKIEEVSANLLPTAYKVWGTECYHEAKELKSENAALRNEADENAALSIKNKLRADRLEKENAALRERLEKAVELPFFKKATKLDWNPLTQESTLIEIYLLIYEDFDGYLCYNEIKDEEAAVARLAELKGGEK